MAIVDHAHDRGPGGKRLHELADWSFHAAQPDKRFARTALVVLGTVSVITAIAFLVVNFV